MTFIDLVSIGGAIASFAALFGSKLERFRAYRQWLTGFGLFFLGLVTAKLLDAIIPSKDTGFYLTSRGLAWSVVLFVAALVIMITVVKEGSNNAIWAALMFGFILTVYAGPLLKDNGFPTNEMLAIVDLREKTGNFDAAISLLEELEKSASIDEKEAIKQRITQVRLRKMQQLSGDK